MENIFKKVQEKLDKHGYHFASHPRAEYCYINANDFDYSGVSSYPISVAEAYELGGFDENGYIFDYEFLNE